MRRAFATGVAVVVAAATMIGAPTTQAGSQGPALTFATYNICKRACGSGRFTWEKRRAAVVRTIAAAGADVVLVQEAAGTVEDLARQLRVHGYVLANTVTDRCPGACTLDSFVFYKSAVVEAAPLRAANPPIPEKCLAYLHVDEPPFTGPPEFTMAYPDYPDYPEYPDLWPDDPGYAEAIAAYEKAVAAYEQAVASHDQKVAEWEAARDANEAARRAYFKAVQNWQAEAGSCRVYESWTPYRDDFEGVNTLAAVAKTGWPRAIMDRGWSYAYLQHKGTKAAFLAVSVHLPNEKTKDGERVRRAAVRGVLETIAADRSRRGLGAVPTVVAGDLNSYRRRQPRGAQFIVGRAGYTDVYSARKRTNADVATVNVTPAFPEPFPPKPFRSADPARIDYVFHSHGRAVHYEVFLRLKGGRFDNRYRGSDHNLVKGTVRIPVVRVG